MLRRKKIAKLKRMKESVIQTKKPDRIDRIIQEVKRAAKDPAVKKLHRELWLKEYSAGLRVSDQLPERTIDWSGSTAKKRLHHEIDYDTLEDLNQKRKDAGLVDIETGIKIAQDMIAERKTRVAPAYNKGGVQLLSPSELKDSGKKTSQLEF